MSLDTYEKILAIRAKQREPRDIGVSTQTFQSLAQDEANLAAKAVEDISASVVSECGAHEPGGRSPNERAVQMRKTVQFVMRQIDQGVQIEILLPPHRQASMQKTQRPGNRRRTVCCAKLNSRRQFGVPWIESSRRFSNCPILIWIQE